MQLREGEGALCEWWMILPCSSLPSCHPSLCRTDCLQPVGLADPPLRSTHLFSAGSAYRAMSVGRQMPSWCFPEKHQINSLEHFVSTSQNFDSEMGVTHWPLWSAQLLMSRFPYSLGPDTEQSVSVKMIWHSKLKENLDPCFAKSLLQRLLGDKIGFIKHDKG